MKKTTLTFYLPKDTLKRAKIFAVKSGSSFSELAVRCVLALIDGNSFDLQKRCPRNDEKALVYLNEDEKKRIKLFAAAKAVTISEIFYQALEQNLENDQILSIPNKNDGKDRPVTKPKPPVKKNPFSYSLTYENDSKLRLKSAETGKSRTQLILEALEKADNDMIMKVPHQEPKKVRSSMDLSPKKIAYLKNRAQEMNIGLSELINRALALL